MTAHLIRGDARRLPLATGSVQAIVTSPPYLNLRSYGGQTSIWGGDPECPHTLADDPAVKPMTGGTGPTSGKQTSNKGSQFVNAWAETSTIRGQPPISHNSTLHEKPEVKHTQGVGGVVASERGKEITSATCTRCGAWRGELGSEPTPALFVAHLVEVFRECWRVLRDDGVCFLNIGDSYSSHDPGGFRQGQFLNPGGRPPVKGEARNRAGSYRPGGTRPKSLLLVPERLAIALSDDGWIIRQVLIWSKNNPMPESVRDRWTTAHEYVLMLVKQPRYFFDQAGIAEKVDLEYLTKRYGGTLERGWPDHMGGKGTEGQAGTGKSAQVGVNPSGTRNGRSVWEISTDPYKGAHYAVYPRELVRRCVAAATSDYGACAACGAAYRRVVERGASTRQGPTASGWREADSSDLQRVSRVGESIAQTTGWAPTCRCDPAAGVRPCVVLDPFSGSATTAYQAARMGRIGIGVELSEAYIAQAQAGRLAQGFLPLSPEAIA